MIDARTSRRHVEEIRSLAHPLVSPRDLDPLVERIGDARLVLVGEASHGTAEFYRWRAELTRRLVAEEGFDLVAVEGDWPDCARLDRWVKSDGDPLDAGDVLRSFHRWPTWMWANTVVADFLRWLREHDRATGRPVGFFGLDVYSLWESMDAVLRHLRDHHPDEVDSAIAALRCFEPHGEDPQSYARASRFVSARCEDEVVELLADLHRLADDGEQARVGRIGTSADTGSFDALQNAEVIAGAERYYRAMIQGGSASWNVRDLHMADTLDRLLEHHGPSSRAVVWEHNTHVGDARATDMASVGMVNVGQLARERHGDDEVVLVGFSSHEGTVVAGPRWGAPAQIMHMPAARSDSHEALLHSLDPATPHLLIFPDDRGDGWLAQRRGHRAVGVVYDPGRDRAGNWVPTVMGARYDALIHIDRTSALVPLTGRVTEPGETDTYPWAS